MTLGQYIPRGLLRSWPTRTTVTSLHIIGIQVVKAKRWYIVRTVIWDPRVWRGSEHWRTSSNTERNITRCGSTIATVRTRYDAIFEWVFLCLVFPGRPLFLASFSPLLHCLPPGLFSIHPLAKRSISALPPLPLATELLPRQVSIEHSLLPRPAPWLSPPATPQPVIVPSYTERHVAPTFVVLPARLTFFTPCTVSDVRTGLRSIHQTRSDLAYYSTSAPDWGVEIEFGGTALSGRGLFYDIEQAAVLEAQGWIQFWTAWIWEVSGNPVLVMWAGWLKCRGIKYSLRD